MVRRKSFGVKESMNQDIAVIKGMSSLEEELNYSLEYTQLKCIRKYFYIMYGVGFNEGNRQRSKFKMVLQMKRQLYAGV